MRWLLALTLVLVIIPEARAARVVELFTSEGCHSCPPAETLLKEVHQLHKDEVILLAFHVDYWDSLGWKDPFSQAGFTQRQEAYRQQFRLPTLATPQMVISGKKVLNGTKKTELEIALKDAYLAVPGAELWLNGIAPEWLVLKSALPKNAPAGAKAWYFLSQEEVSTKVLRGENAGKLLTHRSVVLSSVSQVESQAGRTVQLAYPKGKDPNQYRVTVLWQNPSTLAVIAAESELVKDLTP